MPFGLKPGFAGAPVPAFADADGAALGADAALAVAAVVGVAVVVAAGGAVTAGFAVVATAGAVFGPKPKSCGARHKTIASPIKLTSTSMTEKTKNFCRADGPRGRTTTVGVRGRRGRSGMRIVSATCPGRTGGRPSAAGLNACGVFPVAPCGGTARIPPELGVPTRCGPDDGWFGLIAIATIGGAIGVVICGLGGTTSSCATMTAGA